MNFSKKFRLKPLCVLQGFASCCLCFNNLKGGTSQNNKLPPISHYVNF